MFLLFLFGVRVSGLCWFAYVGSACCVCLSLVSVGVILVCGFVAMLV